MVHSRVSVLSVVVPICSGKGVYSGSVAVGLSLLPGKKVTLARGQGVPFVPSLLPPVSSRAVSLPVTTRWVETRTIETPAGGKDWYSTEHRGT